MNREDLKKIITFAKAKNLVNVEVTVVLEEAQSNGIIPISF